MSEQDALWLGNFSLRSLASSLGASMRGVDPEAVAKEVVTDSRRAGPGDLFVALLGERFDGHDFVPEVEGKGAVAALVSRPSQDADRQLLVPDTLVGLQQLGAFLWRQYTQTFDPWSVALTGSNGKTTTREMLRAIFQTLTPKVHATVGNLNNHIGLPLTLCALPQGTTGVVLEMGANKVGDIRELIELAPARARLVTSIGPAHLEGFGSMEGVRQGKSEIFRQADASTLALVPWTERDLPRRQDFCGHTLTFGKQPGADVHIRRAVHTEAGLEVQIRLPDGRPIEVTLPMVGLHHADNLAGALGVAWGLWGGEALPGEEALGQALGGMQVPGGRWRVVEVGPWHLVDDAYNANPGSVRASFESFLVWQRSKPAHLPRIAVLGQMMELGEEAKNWHEEAARSIAGVDELSGLICVGQYARSMSQAARRTQANRQVLEAATAQEAARLLQEHWGQGVVWLKASRGMQLERVISALQDDAPTS